jgi:hypothetical protein
MLFHRVLAADNPTFIANVHDICEAMVALLWTDSEFTGADLAAAGSTIFLPVSWDVITQEGGSAPDVNSSPSAFLNWGGRDSNGRRVKLYLFEVSAPPRQDMRFNDGESALVDAVTDALNGEGSTIATISGLSPIWYTYANVGQNDFLTHRARRS